MKILKWGLLVVALVAVGGYVWWTNFGPLARITPKVAFSLEAAPDAPDYAQDTAWVALPDREDEADLVPPGVEPGDRQADAVADFFFIHPTTYILPNWNAPLDTKSRSQEFIELIVASNGSVFNGCCRVFAPQYRQATLAAFIVDEADGLKALDLAYQDVRRASEVVPQRPGPRPTNALTNAPPQTRGGAARTARSQRTR